MAEETEQKVESNEAKTATHKPSKKLIIILSVVAGIIVVFGVSSTLLRVTGRKVTEEAVEKAIEENIEGKVEVDISEEGKRVTVETEEGTFIAGEQELPQDFPEDIPVYSDAQVVNRATSPQGTIIVLMSQDSWEDVTDYYEEELSERGWTIDSTTNIENATFFEFSKGNESGAIVISQTEKGTQIAIEVTQEESDEETE